MKTLFLSLLTLLAACHLLSAAGQIITVDNNPGAVAMYTSVQDAYDAADDSDPDNPDTILVAGSSDAYGSLNVYKKVIIVGQGYFLGANSIPGLNTNASTLNVDIKKEAQFGDGSGTKIVGINGRINTDAGTTDVVIDKCLNNANNWDLNGQATITRSYHRNSLLLDAANSSISNSICWDLRLTIANTTADHCVVRQNIETVPSSSISNTIFLMTAANQYDLNGSYSYCMTIGANWLPEGGGNINNQLLLDVFSTEDSDNRDRYYQLAEESSAIGAGLNGADMGAFGGDNPYVLSGVPGVPRITRFSVPSTATGLTALEFEVEAQAFAE